MGPVYDDWDDYLAETGPAWASRLKAHPDRPPYQVGPVPPTAAHPARRRTLIGWTGEVLGRGEDADPDGFIPVPRGGTVHAVRLGDYEVDGSGQFVAEPTVVPLNPQTFLPGSGSLQPTITVSLS